MFGTRFQKLLDIEQNIQEEEFNKVYELVAQRERASQARMTQFEIERAAIRNLKLARQQSRLRAIMDELADREAFRVRLA